MILTILSVPDFRTQVFSVESDDSSASMPHSRAMASGGRGPSTQRSHRFSAMLAIALALACASPTPTPDGGPPCYRLDTRRIGPGCDLDSASCPTACDLEAVLD